MTCTILQEQNNDSKKLTVGKYLTGIKLDIAVNLHWVTPESTLCQET